MDCESTYKTTTLEFPIQDTPNKINDAPWKKETFINLKVY